MHSYLRRLVRLLPAALLVGLMLGLGSLVSPALWGQTPAIDSREGLPVVQWDEARQVEREVAIVYGRVAQVGGTPNITFLNFSRDDRAAFKVVVFANSLANFPGELRTLYEGKNVEVQGLVSLYEGNPQIVVTSPSQVRVVEELPQSWLPKKQIPIPGEEIKVGTFNVLNLFDAVDDPYSSDETTPEKPRSELVAIAETIRALNADVLALQEVENIGYLRRFVDVFLSDQGYEQVVLVEGNDGRGIDVAVLSRFPLGATTSYAQLRFGEAISQGATDRFQRDLLCVEILPPQGTPFDVYVVHLKSKGGDEASDPIRMAEARQIRDIFLRQWRTQPDRQFLICGDFNDLIDSASLQTIVGTEEPRLRTLFDAIPEPARVTYNLEPHRNMIDFILCSPALARRFVPGSYEIRHGSVELTGSDHNPVACRFRKYDAAFGGAKSTTAP